MPASDGLLKRERSVHAAAWNTGSTVTVVEPLEIGPHLTAVAGCAARGTAVRLRNNMPTVAAFEAGVK